MNFRFEDQSGKQFRFGARRVRYDRGAQVFFENKDLARDFAEFAKVMSVLLNDRRALAGQFGGLFCELRFQTPDATTIKTAALLDYLTA